MWVHLKPCWRDRRYYYSFSEILHVFFPEFLLPWAVPMCQTTGSAHFCVPPQKAIVFFFFSPGSFACWSERKYSFPGALGSFTQSLELAQTQTHIPFNPTPVVADLQVCLTKRTFPPPLLSFILLFWASAKSYSLNALRSFSFKFYENYPQAAVWVCLKLFLFLLLLF